MPRRRLAARTFARRPASGSAPRVCSVPTPYARDDPGVPRPRGMRACGGAPDRTALASLACGLHPPCVLSPDPVTTPGRP
eukprot:6313087-Prymnesium_polylepis.1